MRMPFAIEFENPTNCTKKTTYHSIFFWAKDLLTLLMKRCCLYPFSVKAESTLQPIEQIIKYHFRLKDAKQQNHALFLRNR